MVIVYEERFNLLSSEQWELLRQQKRRLCIYLAAYYPQGYLFTCC